MSFSVIQVGGYAFGERLPSSWANAIDADHAAAIDGVLGGTYTPSNAIIIGGSGLQVGAFTTTGNTTLGSDNGDTLTINAVTTVASAWTFANGSAPVFNDGPIFNNTATFNSGVILGNAAADAITVNGTLTVNNDATIGSSSGDTCTFQASVVFEGPITFSGDLAITGVVALENDCTFGTNASDLIDVLGRFRLGRVMEFQNSGSGIGRVPFRTMTLPDSDATVTVADGNVFKVRNDTTALRTYTIGDTSAADGDFMLFISGAGSAGTLAEEVHIDSPTSGQDEVWADAANSQWSLFIRVGGAWLKMNFAAE